MQIIWLNFSPWNKQQKRLNFSQAKDQPKGTKQGLDLWQQLAICTGGCLGPRSEGLHHSVPKPCIPAILSASGKQETHSMLWVAHNKSITHPKLPFSNNGRKSPTQNTVQPSTALSSPRRLLLTAVRPGRRPASRGGPRRASGCWPLATVGSPRLTSYGPIIADARELGRGRERRPLLAFRFASYAKFFHSFYSII